MQKKTIFNLSDNFVVGIKLSEKKLEVIASFRNERDANWYKNNVEEHKEEYVDSFDAEIIVVRKKLTQKTMNIN